MKITQEHVGKKVIRTYPGVSISRTEITVLWANDDQVLLSRTGEDKTVYLVKNECFRFEEAPPPKKYRPFRWEEREQLRGRWVKRKLTEGEWQITNIEKHHGGLYVQSLGSASALLVDCVFLDTGLPVGVEE